MDAELVTRLNRIEGMLAAPVERQVVKDWYDTEELARLVGKAEFTVREWCPAGQDQGREAQVWAGRVRGLGHQPRGADALSARRTAVRQAPRMSLPGETVAKFADPTSEVPVPMQEASKLQALSSAKRSAFKRMALKPNEVFSPSDLKCVTETADALVTARLAEQVGDGWWCSLDERGCPDLVRALPPGRPGLPDHRHREVQAGYRPRVLRPSYRQRGPHPDNPGPACQRLPAREFATALAQGDRRAVDADPSGRDARGGLGVDPGRPRQPAPPCKREASSRPCGPRRTASCWRPNW
jgi:hypothetical protein